MLSPQAAVTILRKVVEDRTWAQGRVAEQPVDPVREVLDSQANVENQRPYIAIYADSADTEPVGHDGGGQFVEAVIKMSIIVGPGIIKVDGDYIAQLDSHHAGLTVNMVGRQIRNAMHSGNTDWVKLWHRLCRKITKVSSRFMLVEIENPVRVPCLELTFNVCLLPEPEIGTQMGVFWKEFTDLLRANGGGELADTYKKLIEQPSDLPSYALLQAQMGYTDEAMFSVGEYPFDINSVDPDTGEPPILQNVTLSDGEPE